MDALHRLEKEISRTEHNLDAIGRRGTDPTGYEGLMSKRQYQLTLKECVEIALRDLRSRHAVHLMDGEEI